MKKVNVPAFLFERPPDIEGTHNIKDVEERNGSCS